MGEMAAEIAHQLRNPWWIELFVPSWGASGRRRKPGTAGEHIRHAFVRSATDFQLSGPVAPARPQREPVRLDELLAELSAILGPGPGTGRD